MDSPKTAIANAQDSWCWNEKHLHCHRELPVYRQAEKSRIRTAWLWWHSRVFGSKLKEQEKQRGKTQTRFKVCSAIFKSEALGTSVLVPAEHPSVLTRHVPLTYASTAFPYTWKTDAEAHQAQSSRSIIFHFFNSRYNCLKDNQVER